jgi:hypothetical protein
MSMLLLCIAEPWRRSQYGCATLRVVGTDREHLDLRRSGG